MFYQTPPLFSEMIISLEKLEFDINPKILQAYH